MTPDKSDDGHNRPMMNIVEPADIVLEQIAGENERSRETRHNVSFCDEADLVDAVSKKLFLH